MCLIALGDQEQCKESDQKTKKTSRVYARVAGTESQGKPFCANVITTLHS
jgi:hypothetical protein